MCQHGRLDNDALRRASDDLSDLDRLMADTPEGRRLDAGCVRRIQDEPTHVSHAVRRLMTDLAKRRHSHA